MLDLLKRLADEREAQERHTHALWAAAANEPENFVPSELLTEARRAIAEMREIERPAAQRFGAVYIPINDNTDWRLELDGLGAPGKCTVIILVRVGGG
jgi:hypothetical protein